MPEPLRDIPVNLITGMLGAGKTTLVSRLLEQRPSDERWAVLVNEFGETGIDGARLRESGVHVREVAGGCMGCSAAVTLKVELNRLLRQARPARLLVEPTGLGHPLELLELFSGDFYRGVLDLRSTLCLVDARRLADPRFRDAPLWQQQLEGADVLVGTKSDQWTAADHERFDALAREHGGQLRGTVITEQGLLPLHWLEGRARGAPGEAKHHHQEAPPFHGCGWHLPAALCFPVRPLEAFLETLACERIKGNLRTPEGGLRIDGVAGELKLETLPRCEENRLHLISVDRVDCEALKQQLLALAEST